jgi:transposase
VPNCKSFLVTEGERKHVNRRARFQQHRDASCHQAFSFLQGKAPKEIYAILKETLGEHATSYATVKNWVTQFKRGDFSTCDAPCPGRPKTVTSAEIIDQIHELSLEDGRISAKSIAEQLGISCEQVGPIIHAEALREVVPEMPERGSKTSTVPVV